MGRRRGFLKRVKRGINKGLFNPINRAAIDLTEDIDDIINDVEKGGKEAVKEVKGLTKDIEREAEDVAKEMIVLEKRYNLLKYSGKALGIGLTAVGIATLQPEIGVLGSAVALGASLGSDAIKRS